MGLGMKAEIRFSDCSEWPGDKQVLRNVTEIHYCYPTHTRALGKPIAFESDIHGTGITHSVSDIAEFEVHLETEKASEFYAPPSSGR